MLSWPWISLSLSSQVHSGVFFHAFFEVFKLLEDVYNCPFEFLCLEMHLNYSSRGPFLCGWWFAKWRELLVFVLQYCGFAKGLGHLGSGCFLCHLWCVFSPLVWGFSGLRSLDGVVTGQSHGWGVSFTRATGSQVPEDVPETKREDPQRGFPYQDHVKLSIRVSHWDGDTGCVPSRGRMEQNGRESFWGIGFRIFFLSFFSQINLLFILHPGHSYVSVFFKVAIII